MSTNIYAPLVSVIQKFMDELTTDIQQNLQLSEIAAANGDEDTSDYYSVRAIAKDQVLNRLSRKLNEFIETSNR